MKNRNFIFTIIILAIACALSLASYLPTRFDSAVKVKAADFPKTIGEWSSQEMSITEKEYKILETRNLFVREYKNPQGESLYLYIVYSEDNRKATHPPEVCYMGSGATIVEKSTLKITPTITANKMVTEEGALSQLVVYWYRTGSFNTDKYLKQQLMIVFKRLLGQRPSGALIRLSTKISAENLEGALKTMKKFSTLIEPLLDKYLP